MSRFRSHLALAAVAIVFAARCSTTSIARDFSPRSGQVCDQIRITGDHLHLGTTTVTFNGIPARFEWNPPMPSATTPTELLATVPPGATTGPLRVKIDIGFNILLARGSDQVLGTFEVTGSPAAPTISSFTATPMEVEEGSPVTLNWNVSGHTALTLDGINVFGTSSRTVTPAGSRTYRLLATNRCVSRSADVSVRVIPRPFLNAVSGTFFAGAPLTLTGRGLARTGMTTRLIFTQGTMPPVEVTPTSTADTRLVATIPATFQRGSATVQARVGTSSSNVVSFQIGGFQNGPFVEATSRIGTTPTVTCGSRTLTLTATGTNIYNALFREGSRTLESIDVRSGPLTGAGFSPGCANAIVVTHVDASTAQLIVQPFRTGAAPFNDFRIRTDVPERWHLLFSPDDLVLIATTGTISGATAPLTVTLGSLENGRSLADFAGCAAGCRSVMAALESSTRVRVTVDGTELPLMTIP